MEWHDRIGRRLRLRDLHTLFTVAETGSMAKAAALLSVTQPAISKAIGDMEDTLGARLLDRGARGVELTAHGRALLKHGSAAFAELRRAVREMEVLSDPDAGELRLGSVTAMMGGLLAAIADKLTRRYPRLALHIVQAQTIPLLYRDLRERNLELIMGRLVATAGAQEDLETTHLQDEPMYVVVGSANPWVRRRKVSLADLADEAWCLPMPDTLPGGYVVEAFRNAGITFPKRVVLANSLQMQCFLLGTGRYFSLFPRSFLRFNAQKLAIRTLPVTLAIHTAPIVIVRLKNRPMSSMAQRFVACAKTLA